MIARRRRGRFRLILFMPTEFDKALAQGNGLVADFRYMRTLTSSNGDNRRDVIATVFKGVDNRMKSGYLLCQMNLLLHGLDAPQIDPGIRRRGWQLQIP